MSSRRCYYPTTFSEAKDFDGIVQFCESKGMSLAYPRSKDEVKEVGDQFSKVICPQVDVPCTSIHEHVNSMGPMYNLEGFQKDSKNQKKTSFQVFALHKIEKLLRSIFSSSEKLVKSFLQRVVSDIFPSMVVSDNFIDDFKNHEWRPHETSRSMAPVHEISKSIINEISSL